MSFASPPASSGSDGVWVKKSCPRDISKNNGISEKCSGIAPHDGPGTTHRLLCLQTGSRKSFGRPLADRELCQLRLLISSLHLGPYAILLALLQLCLAGNDPNPSTMYLNIYLDLTGGRESKVRFVDICTRSSRVEMHAYGAYTGSRWIEFSSRF